MLAYNFWCVDYCFSALLIHSPDVWEYKGNPFSHAVTRIEKVIKREAGGYTYTEVSLEEFSVITKEYLYVSHFCD